MLLLGHLNSSAVGEIPVEVIALILSTRATTGRNVMSMDEICNPCLSLRRSFGSFDAKNSDATAKSESEGQFRLPENFVDLKPIIKFLPRLDLSLCLLKGVL